MNVTFVWLESSEDDVTGREPHNPGQNHEVLSSHWLGRIRAFVRWVARSCNGKCQANGGRAGHLSELWQCFQTISDNHELWMGHLPRPVDTGVLGFRFDRSIKSVSL